MSASANYSQTSSKSTADRARLITLCEQARDEVKLLRVTVEDYEEALRLSQSALDSEGRAGRLTAQQLTERTNQVAYLELSLKKSKDAFAEKEKQVFALEGQITSLRKRKNFFKGIAKYTTVAAVILGTLVYVQNR